MEEIGRYWTSPNISVSTTLNKGFIYPRPMPPIKESALLVIQVRDGDELRLSTVIGISLREAKSLQQKQGITFFEDLDAEDRDMVNQFLAHRTREAVEEFDRQIFGKDRVAADRKIQ